MTATMTAANATIRAVSAVLWAVDMASSVRAPSATSFAARSAFDGSSTAGNIALAGILDLAERLRSRRHLVVDVLAVDRAGHVERVRARPRSG